MKGLLFKIYAEGREFIVYSDGTVEGFEPPVRVINNLASYEVQAVLDYRKSLETFASAASNGNNERQSL